VTVVSVVCDLFLSVCFGVTAVDTFPIINSTLGAYEPSSTNGNWRVEQLKRACARVALAHLRDAAPYAMFVSSILLACFLLDMAADTQGLPKACWAPLLFVSIVFLAWLKNKMENNDESEESMVRRPKVEISDFTPPPV